MKLRRVHTISALCGFICAVGIIRCALFLNDRILDSSVFDIKMLNVMHAQSCGMQAYYFSISRLGLTPDESVANNLQTISDSRLGVLQLGEIAKSLKALGAKISVFETSDTLGALNKLNDSTVAIVHLNNSTVGHFITVSANRKNQDVPYLIKDGKQPFQEISRKNLDKLILEKASGWIMFVQHGSIFDNMFRFLNPCPKLSFPIEVQKRYSEIDNAEYANDSAINGEIIAPKKIVHKYDPSQQTTLVKVKIKNNTSSPLVIREVKGSCKCFLKTVPSVPFVVSENEERLFEAEFSIVALQRASSTQLVLLTNSLTNGMIVCSVEFLSDDSKLPFFLNNRTTLGYVDPTHTAESLFFLLREMQSRDIKSSVRTIKIEAANGAVELLSTKKAVVAGKTFCVDTIKVRLLKVTTGFNFVKVNVTTSTGNVIPIALSAFCNN